MNRELLRAPGRAEHLDLPRGFDPPDECQKSSIDGVLSPFDMIEFARERWNNGDCDRWPDIAQAVLDAWDEAARTSDDEPNATQLGLCSMARHLGFRPSRLWALAMSGDIVWTYVDGLMMFDVALTEKTVERLRRNGNEPGNTL